MQNYLAAKRAEVLPMLEISLLKVANQLEITTSRDPKLIKTRLLYRNFDNFIAFCQGVLFPFCYFKALEPYFCRICKVICILNPSRIKNNRHLLHRVFPLKEVIPPVGDEDEDLSKRKFFTTLYEYSALSDQQQEEKIHTMRMPSLIMPGTRQKKNTQHACLQIETSRLEINLSCCTVDPLEDLR